MATLTVQTIDEDGLNPSFAAAGGSGDLIPNDGRTYAEVVNGSDSSITVTITAQKTSTTKPGFGAVSKANAGGAVPAGERRKFGPFPAAFNNDQRQVAITYSAPADVTVGAFRLPVLD